MFADPQVITVASVAKSMPRIETGGLSSKYSTADENYKLSISHQRSNKRIRSMARVDQRAVVPDPLTAVNDYESIGIYLVIDRPEVGFTDTQINDLVAGYKTWLTSTIVSALVGLQS